MPSLGPILAATVNVPDLERAASAYRALLLYQVLAAGRSGGSPWQVLGPRGARSGLVRLVEAPDAVRPATFRTLGWAALEILVADADAALERCLQVDGFEVLQRPTSVGGSTALRALQAAGPGGEGVYLTQVVKPSELFSLPSLEDGEHRVYVVVAATHDVPATRGYFETAFAVPRMTDHGLPVRVLNQAYGLPPETLHRVSTMQLAGSTLIEVDEYPPAATRRPAGASGLTSVTFAGPRPAEGGTRLLPASEAPPYWGAPAWELTGPFGLRMEVVER